MANLLMYAAPFFPYDPAIDSHREHLHLMLIYFIVWGVQFGYASFVFYRRHLLIKERARREVSRWRD